MATERELPRLIFLLDDAGVDLLADIIQRTTDWVSQVQNDHIPVDRLSVIAQLAEALDVTIGDLIAEPFHLKHANRRGRVTVLVHAREILKPKTLATILDQGWHRA